MPSTPASPRKPSSSAAASESPVSTLLSSSRNVRNAIDRILGELDSSPSTAPTTQTLAPSLSPSRLEVREIVTRGYELLEGSSDAGKEDEWRYGEEQFDYGDEASDGYEDEDKSMTSSDGEDVDIEAQPKEQKDGNEDHDSGDCENPDKTARPSKPAFSKLYVQHYPADIKTQKTSGNEKIQEDTMEEVLNTTYMTGRTASSQYTSGAWPGPGLIPKSEQNRRDNLRTQINEELTKKWEQEKSRIPQAAAEEDRYDSGDAAEWVLDAESSDGSEKVYFEYSTSADARRPR
ncbi:hypothetical protein IAQ61_004635 [Plenodomus lingam]|uniref:uncharacterized protein n=1 Tax=Leptosphaeria maculans TaxID=5022 RepID=UPI00331AC9D2|nr:hypothetical protein IAQ61_004635 [Plenodomus lingam]